MKPALLRTSEDRDLIEAAKRGDRSAFTTLVMRYEETVYRFAFKVCGDASAADETLQDTFISVYRKLGTFDGKSKFSTWLYTVVTNNCLMKRRKRKRDDLERSLEALDEPPATDEGKAAGTIARWDTTPADTVLQRELRDLLDRAIKRLPLDYRVVFILRDVEGRSNEETARIVGISGEAAKSRLRRARAYLREQLDPYMRSH